MKVNDVIEMGGVKHIIVFIGKGYIWTRELKEV